MALPRHWRAAPAVTSSLLTKKVRSCNSFGAPTEPSCETGDPPRLLTLCVRESALKPFPSDPSADRPIEPASEAATL